MLGQKMTLSAQRSAIRANDLKIECIPPTALADVLPLVEDDLRAVLEKHSEGEYDYNELLRRLFMGVSQLWIVAEKSGKIQLIGVTRFVLYQLKRRLSIDLLAGKNLSDAIHLLDYVENWALQNGAVETEAWVRPGLSRVMKNHGFKKAYEVIIRPIERGRN